MTSDAKCQSKQCTTMHTPTRVDEDQEWLIEEILAHKWTNNNLELQVKWTLGDVTWEPLSSCKDLEALDIYLEL